MSNTADTIAGFGFCTDGARPDLSDLDAQLARIEATGASHCELSLYELDLVVGGRVLPERRRRLEQICARRALQLHRARRAHRQLHGRGASRRCTRRCAGRRWSCATRSGRACMAHHPGRVPATPRRGPRAPARDRARHAARDGRRRRRLRRAGSRSRTCSSRMPATYTADPVRLAREIAAIDHPHVCGLLDFSHAYIMAQFRGMDYLETLAGVRARRSITCTCTIRSAARPASAASIASPSRSRSAWAICICRWAGATSRGMPSCPRLRLRPGTVMIVELPSATWRSSSRAPPPPGASWT